jgi:hypothetical protein
VTAQGATDPWAKAGLMLRGSTDPAAPFYALFVTPGNGLNVQYRTAQGATAQEAAQLAGTVPVSLRLTRVGATYTAFTSADGVVWTPVAGSTVSLPNLAGSILAGLAVSAHNTGAASVVTMTSVSLTTGSTPASTPISTLPALPAPSAATMWEVCLPHPRGSLLAGIARTPQALDMPCGVASADLIVGWARR